jgi:hypothetical protein
MSTEAKENIRFTRYNCKEKQNKIRLKQMDYNKLEERACLMAESAAKGINNK